MWARLLLGSLLVTIALLVSGALMNYALHGNADMDWRIGVLIYVVLVIASYFGDRQGEGDRSKESKRNDDDTGSKGGGGN